MKNKEWTQFSQSIFKPKNRHPYKLSLENVNYKCEAA